MTKSKAFVPMNLYTVSQTCCPAGGHLPLFAYKRGELNRHPLVMGNWKLNGNRHMVHELVSNLRKELAGVAGCAVAIRTTGNVHRYGEA